jgi:predicted metalloendopeptidase
LYVDAVFGETDRMKANELIKNIREMFGENLNTLKWIDDQSKGEAKKKLDKIKEKIGYPDFIKNETKLNERLVRLIRRSFLIILYLVIKIIL